MKFAFKMSIYLLLLALILPGCRKSYKDIVFSNTCSFPCWEGVQLDVTSKQDAFELIRKVTAVDVSSLTFRGEPSLIFDDGLLFEFDSHQSVGEIKFINDRAVQISFWEELGITLGEALEHLEAPQFVINLPVYGGPPLHGSFSSGIILINPLVGYSIIIDTRDQPRRLRNVIDQESKLAYIGFFEPGIYESMMEEGLFSSRILNGEETRKHLIPWDGYGNLEEKYPQVDMSYYP